MSIKYHYKKYNVIFISIFICSISFIMFSCKDSGENSELEVAGGKVIDDSEYPGVVCVDVLNSPTRRSCCTGSIISSNAVLTAAHCTHFPQNPSRVYIDKNRFVTTQKIVINSNYIDDETFWEKFENNEEKRKKKEENSKNDIAIWIFPNGTFKNYEGKLQISDIDFKELAKEEVEVRLIGWGCYTELKTDLDKNNNEITATVNGITYKRYKWNCDKSKEYVKRTGLNVVDTISEDQTSIIMYSRRVDETKVKGKTLENTGSGVLSTPGDSGSPLLLKEQDTKILGINSMGSTTIWDLKYCNAVFKIYTPKWMECHTFTDVYINPITSYNMDTLLDAVDNHKAIIPGVQVGVRVIEYNGKVKILYKEEKTSFNENVEEYKVVNKFNNNRYNTVEALKQAWRGTDFYERSKASWTFE